MAEPLYPQTLEARLATLRLFSEVPLPDPIEPSVPFDAGTIRPFLDVRHGWHFDTAHYLFAMGLITRIEVTEPSDYEHRIVLSGDDLSNPLPPQLTFTLAHDTGRILGVQVGVKPSGESTADYRIANIQQSVFQADNEGRLTPELAALADVPRMHQLVLAAGSTLVHAAMQAEGLS